MKIIVSKNCGLTTFFRDLLECLLVNEGDKTGKYIFGLCFPMGPADTGRSPREAGGDEKRRAGPASTGAGPQDTLLSR